MNHHTRYHGDDLQDLWDETEETNDTPPPATPHQDN